MFNPREPKIRQSLFRQLHFIQQFAKVSHRQSSLYIRYPTAFDHK